MESVLSETVSESTATSHAPSSQFETEDSEDEEPPEVSSSKPSKEIDHVESRPAKRRKLETPELDSAAPSPNKADDVPQSETNKTTTHFQQGFRNERAGPRWQSGKQKHYDGKSKHERRPPQTSSAVQPKSSHKQSLLERLLAKEMQNEKNIISQCFRYIIKHNFFENSPGGPLSTAPSVESPNLVDIPTQQQ